MTPALLLASLALMVAPTSQQASAGKPASGGDYSLQALDVEPPLPGPDTLCRLRVRLRNKDLAFGVALNGQPLPVYSNQVWAANPSAGQNTEVLLYNFWTFEPGRQAAKDGALVVEVRLKAARWYDTDGKGAFKGSKDVKPLPPAPSLSVTIPATKRP